MVKVILFDADGVVMMPREKYFSERFSEDYEIDYGEILPFFKDEFQACTLGKADLRKVLPKYLQKWGWKDSLDDFLNYWFTSECETNDELLNFIDGLRYRGEICCLVSDNEKYRAAYLSAVVGLGQHFDDMFFSHDLGLRKESPKFFKKVLQILKVEPSEVYFLGDNNKDVASAGSVGIKFGIYKSTYDFKKIFKKLSNEG